MMVLNHMGTLWTLTGDVVNLQALLEDTAVFVRPLCLLRFFIYIHYQACSELKAPLVVSAQV